MSGGGRGLAGVLMLICVSPCAVKLHAICQGSCMLRQAILFDDGWFRFRHAGTLPLTYTMISILYKNHGPISDIHQD
jgi:hypothetical protein